MVMKFYISQIKTFVDILEQWIVNRKYIAAAYYFLEWNVINRLVSSDVKLHHIKLLKNNLL